MKGILCRKHGHKQQRLQNSTDEASRALRAAFPLSAITEAKLVKKNAHAGRACRLRAIEFFGPGEIVQHAQVLAVGGNQVHGAVHVRDEGRIGLHPVAYHRVEKAAFVGVDGNHWVRAIPGPGALMCQSQVFVGFAHLSHRLLPTSAA